jgi:glyoxalase superfamily protein/peptidase M66-like protein
MSMPRRILRVILAPAVLCMVACGGGAPTRPQPVAATPAPTPTPLPPPVTRDGLTHDVVAAEITPAQPGLRDAVTVRAPGYLLREQRYDGSAIHLWGVEEDYVDQVVYPLTFSDGSFRMIRWAGGFTVTLEQGLDQNDAVLRKTQDTMAEVMRHTGVPITVGPGGAVRVMIDANILAENNALGLVTRTYQGATIVGCVIKFVDVQNLLGNGQYYTNTFLHEMGHVMGLGHSPVEREIQEVQLAIAAKRDAIDLGFWRAVLGYGPMADDNAMDPLGHGSTVWMQELDEAKPLRHAMHVDVSVAREHITARLQAALAAGGRIVRKTDAPLSWTLADRAGNRVCVCAWPDGSTQEPSAGPA